MVPQANLPIRTRTDWHRAQDGRYPVDGSVRNWLRCSRGNPRSGTSHLERHILSPISQQLMRRELRIGQSLWIWQRIDGRYGSTMCKWRIEPLRRRRRGRRRDGSTIFGTSMSETHPPRFIEIWLFDLPPILPSRRTACRPQHGEFRLQTFDSQLPRAICDLQSLLFSNRNAFNECPGAGHTFG